MAEYLVQSHGGRDDGITGVDPAAGGEIGQARRQSAAIVQRAEELRRSLVIPGRLWKVATEKVGRSQQIQGVGKASAIPSRFKDRQGLLMVLKCLGRLPAIDVPVANPIQA